MSDQGVRVRTNGHWREPLYGFQLTKRERLEFDYLSEEEIETRQFIRYRGIVYDLGDFLRIPSDRERPAGSIFDGLSQWDGYQSDSYFSGVVVRWDADCERVRIGTYIS